MHRLQGLHYRLSHRCNFNQLDELTGMDDSIIIDELHIASLIILSRPEKFADILDMAGKLPSAECHYEKGHHKLVLVFEASSDSQLSDIIDSINNWPGVLSVQLAYHHCEPRKSLQEEITHVSHTS